MSARRGSSAAPEFTVANAMINFLSSKCNDARNPMRIDSGAKSASMMPEIWGPKFKDVNPMIKNAKKSWGTFFKIFLPEI